MNVTILGLDIDAAYSLNSGMGQNGRQRFDRPYHQSANRFLDAKKHPYDLDVGQGMDS
jgi:hypothetical protein